MIGDTIPKKEALALAKAAAVVWCVPVSKIMSKSRGIEPVCYARQAAMKLLRDRGYTYEAVGAAFSGRDHGTALHAYRAVSDRLDVLPHFRERYEKFIGLAGLGIAPDSTGMVSVTITVPIPNAEKMTDGELAMAAAQRAILKNSRAKVQRRRVLELA